MQDSSLILVKVVLFQSTGRGHPQDDARSSFSPYSKSLILGLSNDVSFVPEILWKDGYNKVNVTAVTALLILNR